MVAMLGVLAFCDDSRADPLARQGGQQDLSLAPWSVLLATTGALADVLLLPWIGPASALASC